MIKGFFTLCDTPSAEDLEGLPLAEGSLRAKCSREFRPPKAGEWYLSGAIVGAYKARNDLPISFWIAELHITKKLEVEYLVK